MKRFAFFALLCVLAVSCYNEMVEFDVSKIHPRYDVFYASFCNTSNPETRVYLDEELKLRWDADDRISIFDGNTANSQYRFTGNTGDKTGEFIQVGNTPSGGSPLAHEHVFAVYPYSASTSIRNYAGDEIITMNIPSQQTYRIGSFGSGANTLVSVTEDNKLLFKNVCGFLVLKIYGDSDIASVKLEGNNSERFTGTAEITVGIDSDPRVVMPYTSNKSSITVNFEGGLALGLNKKSSTVVWIPVIPTTFSKGFTLTFTDTQGKTFTKSTDKSFTINRNSTLRIAPIEVRIEKDENDFIQFRDDVVRTLCVQNWDTNRDGQLSYGEAVAVTSFGDVFVNNTTIEYFDELRYFTSINNWHTGYNFAGCSNLKSITLSPDEDGQLSLFGFNNCSSLTSVTLLDSKLLDVSLSGCSALEYIDLSNTEELYINGLRDFSNLAEVVLPDQVHVANSYHPFSGCPNLTLTGKYVSDDGRSWLCDCRYDSDIHQYVFEEGVLAFCVPGGLTEYIIPDGVTAIGKHAFTECSGLESIIIPDSVTEIRGDHTTSWGAFAYCRGLSSITIPSGVISIGDDAFKGCSGLTSIVIPERVESIGDSVFSGCSGLTSIVIPERVESIGDSAFSGCSGLTSIVIPERVESIGNSAFSGCSGLTSIVIPERVVFISMSAFYNCTNLEFITVNSTTPPSLGSSAFQNTGDCPIFVKSESLAQYQTAWSSYRSRLAVKPTSVNLHDTSLSLRVGDTHTLTYWLTPSNATSSPKWSSSDPSVATIDEFGVVTAVGSGSAQISVSIYGVEAICQVRVIHTPEPVDLGLSVKWSNANLWGYGGNSVGRRWSWDSAVNYMAGKDVAAYWLGDGWRLPTKREWEDLVDRCTWELVDIFDIPCYKVSSRQNNNYIILPMAGYEISGTLYNLGTYAFYWSSTSYLTEGSEYAYRLRAYDGIIEVISGEKRAYASIRPVYVL